MKSDTKNALYWLFWTALPKEWSVRVHLLQTCLQDTAQSGGSEQTACQRLVFLPVWHTLKAWSFLYYAVGWCPLRMIGQNLHKGLVNHVGLFFWCGGFFLLFWFFCFVLWWWCVFFFPPPILLLEVLCGCVFSSKFINPGFCPCPVETAHPPFSVSRRIAFLLFQFCNFLQHCPVLLIMKYLQ